MTVVHVLKNGTVLNDITGYVVTQKDCPRIYEVFNRLNHKEAKNETQNQKQNS